MIIESTGYKGQRLRGEGKTELRGEEEECGGDATFKSPRT